MSTKIIQCPQDRWRTSTAGFRDHNYRQLWAFGTRCADRVGAASEHVAIIADESVLGLADVRIKLVPLTGTGVAYINGGPLVCRGGADDLRRLRACLVGLQAEYVERRGLVLRIAPPLGPPDWNIAVRNTFDTLGFVAVADAPPRYRTLIVDLRRALPDIRRSLAQKWRNGLNRAERNGLTIRAGTADNMFATFEALYDDLRERKEFGVDLDASFYARVQTELTRDEKFTVTLAEFEGRPVAGHVGSVIGETSIYLLGASNRTGLERKASYLLQWHVLAAAHELGCAWYDLGGIDPQRNAGVYHFKCGLGGVDVTAPGPFEFASSGLARALVHGAERIHRWVRRHHDLRLGTMTRIPCA